MVWKRMVLATPGPLLTPPPSSSPRRPLTGPTPPKDSCSAECEKPQLGCSGGCHWCSMFDDYRVVPGDRNCKKETKRWIWASFFQYGLETRCLGFGAVSCQKLGLVPRRWLCFLRFFLAKKSKNCNRLFCNQFLSEFFFWWFFSDFRMKKMSFSLRFFRKKFFWGSCDFWVSYYVL